MATTKKILVKVTYDETKTSGYSLAQAFDTLLGTALSTPGVLEGYGDISVGDFYPEEEDDVDGLTVEMSQEDIAQQFDLDEESVDELLAGYGDLIQPAARSAVQDVLGRFFREQGYIK